MNINAAPPLVAQPAAGPDNNTEAVRELAATDRRVRAHEAAHLAAAGGLARGGASFSYQRGPDNRLYAVAGEVQIDASKVSGDPQATLRKAQQIQRAALAPADPSAQDRAVAAAAQRMAIEARAALSAEVGSEQALETSNSATSARSLNEPLEVVCPACGGAHAGHVHDGISSYEQSAAPGISNTLVQKA
ncbi:MAG: putative metalloprotease CJM1_0395 family protein [Lysobacterales bacterium]